MSKIFNTEEESFIRKNVEGKTVKELTELFNKKYNKAILESQIRHYKKYNKLKSGINTRFIKNQKSHNYKPIGTEFESTNGYIYIKINDPNEWMTKHKHIYERHNGKVPKGYSVLFADGNKRNFNIENLILVKDKDKLVAKNQHLIFDNAELTKSGLLIAKLINTIAEKKREK